MVVQSVAYSPHIAARQRITRCNAGRRDQVAARSTRSVTEQRLGHPCPHAAAPAATAPPPAQCTSTQRNIGKAQVAAGSPALAC